MRKETTKEYIVRTTTTGYIEADMLGHTLNVAEEMSAKQKSSQRPHRGKLKDSHPLKDLEKPQSGLRRALNRYGQRYQTPSACWRSLKVLKGKGKVIYTRVVNRVRKLFVNS
ncbi:hypothetical protein Mosig_00128 [Pelagibacter phage Mosig EXVC030M]|nr:hypothetical protein Mosig_00128 [Pelagibacter phage Mosig EXVC030M]